MSMTMLSQHYIFDGLEEGEICFRFKVKRKIGGSDYVGFGIYADETPTTFQGKMSVKADEVKWCLNGKSLDNMVNGKYVDCFAFADGLVDKLDVLTIKVAVYFWTE